MSSAQTVNAFLQQYLEDQWSGKRRTLDQYLELFPGDDAAIAERYARLESEAQERPATGPAVERIGPYRILEELGRGGQGVVYLAEDERLRRTVALKVLTGLGSLAPNRVARFLREAEVASRLDHPGIATVYEIGTDCGVPFIAMRYVEGETLATQITKASEGGHQNQDAAVRRSAAIAEKAARALHAAHEAGIIHRDVKPGNILIQEDGTPVIVDFGLAHDSDSELATLTRTGEFFGTPAYMSPEQIATQASKPDRRTDVWSLGATLYEQLTLHRPFEAPTREQLYRAVLAKEPRNARRMNAAVPADLAAIVEMSLQKEVDRRYETAAAMADDLAAFAAGRPVSARAVGPIGRIRRWSRREPAKAGFLLLLLVAIPVIAVLLVNYLANRQRMEAARLVALQDEKDDFLSHGAYEIAENHPDLAISWFEKAARLEGGSVEALAGIAEALFRRQRWNDALAFIEQNDAPLRGLRAASLLRVRALEELGRTSEAEALKASAPNATSALDFYLSGYQLLMEAHGGRNGAFWEAIGEFRKAIFESTAPRAIYFQGLAHAASYAGDLTTCREAASALLRHWPNSPRCAFWAGTALITAAPSEAVRLLREAIRMEPEYAEAYCNLANAQSNVGNVDEAISSYREAIRLRSDLQLAHCNLGIVLRQKGDFDGSIACQREAIRVLPTYSLAYWELGLSLEGKNQVDDAIDAYRKSIQIYPSHHGVHLSLANALTKKGLFDEAFKTFGVAIGLNPKNPEAHYSLALALRKKGLNLESIGPYREALRFRPDWAEAHCNLGRALLCEGWFGFALAELKKGHELGTKQAAWKYPSAEWVDEAENVVGAERRMLDVATGKEESTGPTDLAALGALAAWTKRWRLATGWFEAAFEADPALLESSEQWPLKAARAAIQAAHAADAESRPSRESARLRSLGLAWLGLELKRERELVDAEAWSLERFQKSLDEWRSDRELAVVREESELSRLPPEEARAWRSFWSDLR